MKSKRLLILLLFALLAPWAANAQQALPYSYGFEDNNLSTDGWTKTSGYISSSAAHTGSYGFYFYYSISSDVYLVSPTLTGGTNGIDVTFWYKASNGTYLDHFYVGYTTDENADPSTYTYGSVINSTTSWQQYEGTLPAGTVRIAIKYDEDNYDDGDNLYLDDFSFTAVSPYPAPKRLAVESLSSTSAKLGWTAPNGTVTNYQYQYKETEGSTWSTEGTTTGTSATITGLTLGTSYDFRVKANYSGNPSEYATLTFSTLTPKAIPYAYGFEDAGEDNPDIETIWTVTGEAIDDYTDVWSNSYFYYYFNIQNVARTGNYFFLFSSYNLDPTPVQYLISPQLSGITNGLHVEFYYKKPYSGNETFHVGYSTTDNAPSSFTWSAEYTATDSYQRFSANYPAETKFVAVKYTSDYQYFTAFDDFLFEESASCVEPGEVVYAHVTSNSADISWTPIGSETAWDLYVTDNPLDVPGDEATPTYANVTSNRDYPISGLDDATTYYVYVRARCSSSEHSVWSVPAVFNTKCEGMPLPYTYGFEDAALPVCWSTINTNTSYNDISISSSSPQSGSKHLNLYRGSPEGIQIVALPEVDANYPVNEYEISFYSKLAGSYTTGRALAVGVMTDPADATTFVQVGDLIEPTTEYLQYTVRLFSYTGNGQYLAIKHTSTNYGNTYIDSLAINPLPSCLEPTELAARNITSNSANLSWKANNEETEWTLYYKKVSAETYTEVPNVTQNPYPLTGLEIGTNYQFYVKANCSASEASDPSAVYPFTTECDVLTITSTSPYVENFDSYNVPNYYYNYSLYYGNRFLPNCWSVIDTTHYAENSTIYPTMWNYSQYDYFNSSPNCFRFYLNSSQNQQGQFAILPQMNDVNTLRIRLNAATFSSYYSGDFIFGVMTDPTDARTFTQVGDTIKPTSSYANYTVNFDSYEGNGQYIAIKLFAEGTSYKYLYIDDVVVDPIPTCLEPSNLAVTANGQIATFTWESETGLFDVAYATSATANPDENIAQTGIDTTAYISGTLALGDYYFWVRANCGKDGYSPWPDPVSVHIGYCLPAPTSVDGNGISNVSFGTGENIVDNNTHPSAAPYYGDYSAQIGAVQAGVQATVDITYNTCEYSDCYNYGTVIWIDLNNNLSFEDNEIVFAGQSSPDSYPSGAHTLNATFTIPATQATGDYRMRIGGADSYFDYFISGTATAAHDPCYSGSYTIFEDYTLRVLEAPDCLPAGDVTVAPASIGTTTAVISWTNNNGDEATYTVMQGETVLTTTAVDSYTLTELTAATTYPAGTFTIIPDCDESAIANVPAFTTLCEAITTFPWTEDFEGLTVNHSIPACWDNDEGTTTNDSYKWCFTTDYSYGGYGNTDSTGYNGLNCVRFDSYLNSDNYTSFLKTATLSLPADTPMQLTFWYKNPAGGDFSVYISTDGGATHTTALDENIANVSTWTKHPAIDLSAYAGQEVVIVFKGTSNYGNGDAYIYLDDVTVAFIQTIELVEGWNWISTNLEVSNPFEMLQALETALGDNATLIEHNGATTEYLGSGFWFGTLEYEGMTNDKMYLVHVSDSCTIELQGEPASTTVAITIGPGWNWIGFPSVEEMSITDFLSGFEAEVGDIIEHDGLMSEYLGYGFWMGLDTLVPGNGYLYYSNSQEEKTLYFQIGQRNGKSHKK